MEDREGIMEDRDESWMAGREVQRQCVKLEDREGSRKAGMKVGGLGMEAGGVGWRGVSPMKRS